MVFTDVGRSGVALAIGSFSTNRPQFLGLGSGSGAVLVGNALLIAESGTRVTPTTTDTTTVREVSYIIDYNSFVMSGLGLTEFGMFTLATGGSLWNREGFSAVTFDGTNELQVQLIYKVF